MSTEATTTGGAGGDAGAGAPQTADVAAVMEKWDARDVALPIVDICEAIEARDKAAELKARNDAGEHAETIAKLTKTFDDACTAVANALHTFGSLVVRDKRASKEQNDSFLDMIESYFEQPDDVKMTDTRPEEHYQVGPTPAYIELPRNHCSKTAKLGEDEKALSLCPPERDPKWRYFWRIGDRPDPSETAYPDLNAENVEPAAFPEWAKTMNAWGEVLLNAGKDVATLAAHGFGMEDDALASRMELGPHLLAPTATNLAKHNTVGDVLAGYHYDLNFMTVHGKSRFPGLYVWTRAGVKMPVKVPDGCLLIQAGAQLQHVTGGHVLAGFHEVVVGPRTIAALERAKAAGRSQWRVSSTMFTSLRTDEILKPIAPMFNTPEAVAKYPPIATGEHTLRELKAISLAAPRVEGAEDTPVSSLKEA